MRPYAPAAQPPTLAASATTNTGSASREATGHAPELVGNSLILATALVSEIDYDKAAEISKEAFKNDKTIREVAREQTDLSDEELDEILDAHKMMGT